MLTIDDIKNVSFRKAGLGGGYNADDVDSFVDEVIASFEQLKKEKTNLVHKIDVLATRVEQYRADEETVRNALLASQKVSDACIKEAKEKAAKIIREAETKAQSLVTDANKMTTYEKKTIFRFRLTQSHSETSLLSFTEIISNLLMSFPQLLTLRQRLRSSMKNIRQSRLQSLFRLPTRLLSTLPQLSRKSFRSRSLSRFRLQTTRLRLTRSFLL